MLSLSSSPYSLVLGDSIFARVTAVNDLGPGEPSLESDGSLTVQTLPSIPYSV